MLAAWAFLQRARLLRRRLPASKLIATKLIAAAKRRSFRRATCMHKPTRNDLTPLCETYRDDLSDFCFSMQARCDDFSCYCAELLATSRAVCLLPHEYRGSLQLAIAKQFYGLERLNSAKERVRAGGARKSNTRECMRRQKALRLKPRSDETIRNDLNNISPFFCGSMRGREI